MVIGCSSLSADANPLTLEDRVEATKGFLNFNQKTMTVVCVSSMQLLAACV